MASTPDTDDPLANVALRVMEANDQAVSQVSSSLGVQEPPGRQQVRNAVESGIVTASQFSPFAVIENLGGPDFTAMDGTLQLPQMGGTQLPQLPTPSNVGLPQLPSAQNLSLPGLPGMQNVSVPTPADILPGMGQQQQSTPTESLVPQTGGSASRSPSVDMSASDGGRMASQSR